MPPRPTHADVISTLSVAVAILAEEMNVLGVSTPKSDAIRRRQVRRIEGLARDAAALAAASEVLMRCPGLIR